MRNEIHDMLLKYGNSDTRRMSALAAAEYLIRVALAASGRGWTQADTTPIKAVARIALREHRSLHGHRSPLDSLANREALIAWRNNA